MGLTTWRNAPQGKIVKEDVSIAKNYLLRDDIIKALYETGMWEAQHGRASADSNLEIPKLFRVGLGVVLRGRP